MPELQDIEEVKVDKDDTPNQVDLVSIEKKLQDTEFLGGASPSGADLDAFQSMVHPPAVTDFPRAYAWYNLIARFNPAVKEAWGKSAAASAGPKKPNPQKK